MTMTGLEVFDKTIHATNEWLKDLMFELGWEDRHKAYTALRVSLHALRDNLTVDEAKDLASQLPMLIRGFYYENWKLSAVPEKIKSKEPLFQRIQDVFPNEMVDTESIVRAVFKLLHFLISKGEVQDIRGMLPPALAELWPQRR
jgi:uncharacterized protein (DUF2267 family)